MHALGLFDLSAVTIGIPLATAVALGLLIGACLLFMVSRPVSKRRTISLYGLAR